MVFVWWLWVYLKHQRQIRNNKHYGLHAFFHATLYHSGLFTWFCWSCSYYHCHDQNTKMGVLGNLQERHFLLWRLSSRALWCLISSIFAVDIDNINDFELICVIKSKLTHIMDFVIFICLPLIIIAAMLIFVILLAGVVMLVRALRAGCLKACAIDIYCFEICKRTPEDPSTKRVPWTPEASVIHQPNTVSIPLEDIVTASSNKY